MDEPIRKGDIAYNGSGEIGLITSSNLQPLRYPDGSVGGGYVGIHLTDAIAPIDSSWSARRPIVIGHVDQVGEDPNA